MLVLLGLLPAATYVLAGYAVRPAGGVFAPLRLALVRAAVLIGAVAAIEVEVLGAAHALTRPALAVTWSVATLLALLGAGLRYRRDGRLPRPGTRLGGAWAATGWPERIMLGTLATLLIAELLIAAISPPDNYDSQTYHLPRIEHWVAQRDVNFFATRIHRQLTMAPGAEYLLLHVRLLTGGDALYNLLQYSAGLACALVASRIAGQLGGSPRAQVLAAFVVGTTPIVTLESTSTQTDLVVAAWVACVATLVLDELRRRTAMAEVALLGLATGLTALTKENGLLAAGPLLIVWGVAQLRQGGRPASPLPPSPLPPSDQPPGDQPRGGPAAGQPPGALPYLRTAAAAVVILAFAAAVAGPFLARVDREYGNPLGPPYLRDSISMQAHDPPSVLVNALRVGHTALDTPIGPLDGAVARGIEWLSRAIGVDPDDPRITFTRTTFPTTSWPPDEDKASFPIEGALVLLGAGFLLVRPGRQVAAGHTGPVRAYAAAFWVALLLYLTTIKWQPWGNRLLLYLLVLGAPLAGLWLDSVFRRRTAGWPGRRVAAWVAVAALVVSGCAGALAIGYGWPRRLVGTGSVFTDSDLRARFQRRAQWRAGYEWAAAAVRASGARRVGLVQGADTWEYPWWILLPGRRIEAEQSLRPDLPPVRPADVDAMVCVATRPVCGFYVPPGWQLHMRGDIGYALPPPSPRPAPASPPPVPPRAVR